MTEPGYVGMATGIIGAITGVARHNMGYVGAAQHGNTLEVARFSRTLSCEEPSIRIGIRPRISGPW